MKSAIDTKYAYDEKFVICEDFFKNEKAIDKRVNEEKRIDTKQQKEALRNLLKFLYLPSYSKNAYRQSIKSLEICLEETEKILLYRLTTRSSGSQRKNYGLNAVKAMKKDGYKCVVCNQGDVRCLEIDHVNGRTHEKGNPDQDYSVEDFQTLCANHHRIKTVVENQQN